MAEVIQTIIQPKSVLRTAISLVLVVAHVLCAGCDQSKVPSGAGGARFENGRAFYVYERGRVIYVVLVDRLADKGNFTIGDNVSVRDADGTTFTVTRKGDTAILINGTEYGLANGRVFLCSLTGSTTSVNQLDVDLAPTNDAAEMNEAIKMFILANPDMRKFVGVQD